MASVGLAPAAAMRWAVGGWGFFIAENVVLSENRSHVIAAVGEQNYFLLYGSMSTAACASIVVGFRKISGAAPLQWALHASPPLSRLAACFLLQSIGFAGLAQSLPRLQIPFSRVHVDRPAEMTIPSGASQPSEWKVRCPFDFSKNEGLHGVQRLSRHASLWSFATMCLGAAAVVPSLPQAVSLTMPTAFALIGGAHQDSRQRRGISGERPEALDAATSNVPGVGLLSGAQGDVRAALRALGEETKWVNAGLGVACALLYVLRHVH